MVLYRDAPLAYGRSATLELGVSVLVADGHIAWIRPSDAEEDAGDAEVVDAGGATIVPGMVDCHSHLTLPGGSHWIDRGGDAPEQLVRMPSTTRSSRPARASAGRETSAPRWASTRSTGASAR